jgi:hypothetical protein
MLAWVILISGDQLDADGPFPEFWKGVVPKVGRGMTVLANRCGHIGTPPPTLGSGHQMQTEGVFAPSTSLVSSH